MLQDGDLRAFLEAFEKSDGQQLEPASPREVLARTDGLFAPEVWRLWCSLQIAAALGDAPQAAAAAAQLIHDEVRELRCAPLEDQDAWSRAIAWARAQPSLASGAPLEIPRGRDREAVVGHACLRLRQRGYKVEVGAYGPRIAEESRRDIVRAAESYVSILGGLATADQVLRYLHDVKFYHDGMWLFGEVGLNLQDPKRPMVPVGWLFSLGLRHLAKGATARKPAVAWKSLVDLAVDFAAAHDCQRYSQYAGIDMHATQFHQALQESVYWREFFTLPQVPPNALRQILSALAEKITRDDEVLLGFRFLELRSELTRLLNRSASDRINPYSRADLERDLPLVCRIFGGADEGVNAKYVDPLSADGRTQDNTLLFACEPSRALVMPSAFLASAVCERVFRLIWKKIPKDRASKIVGKTLERTIAQACRGLAPDIIAGESYAVDGQTYEMDVATRDADRVVFMEVKGKSLTQKSRSGDVFSFFQDYSDSFLKMLEQLVRHDVHFDRCLTPINAPEDKPRESGSSDDDIPAPTPLKVAVSPLSYGPVSDKLLSSSALRSLVGTRFHLIVPDKTNQKIIDKINSRVEKILSSMILVAPKRDGLAELFPYLIDVFWLDLGQLLYILDRANTVWDAFGPLKHVTFSSRDFWTELAHADRMGMTRGRWRPLEEQ